MLKLKAALAAINKTQADLARAVDLSPATIAQVINHSKWPKQPERLELEEQIKIFLEKCGAAAVTVSTAFEVEATRPAEPQPLTSTKEDEQMLLRKHSLTPEAKQVFGLVRDPFSPVRSANEVFMTPDARYVRESMRQTAKHGGFIAVVGESGAGKSTLREDLIDWTNAQQQPVVIIQPSVLGMEDNDVKGKTLKSTHIAEAILSQVAPGLTPRRSTQALFNQVENALRASHRAGNRHALIIEEAHCLSIPTLKHMKRFYEIKDGFQQLLGIILIGQSELKQKLDERDPRVREVVQRCELIELRALDNELEGYLKHRFALADKKLDQFMDSESIQALRTKLTGTNYSVLYPLAIHNVLTAALNEAAAIGIPQLTAELITGV